MLRCKTAGIWTIYFFFIKYCKTSLKFFINRWCVSIPWWWMIYSIANERLCNGSYNPLQNKKLKWTRSTYKQNYRIQYSISYVYDKSTATCNASVVYWNTQQVYKKKKKTTDKRYAFILGSKTDFQTQSFNVIRTINGAFTKRDVSPPSDFSFNHIIICVYDYDCVLISSVSR